MSDHHRSIHVLLLSLLLAVISAACAGPSEAQPTSTPEPLPARTGEATATPAPTAALTATAATGAPTPLPADLSLSEPGWIHYVEQVNGGIMATVDPESGEVLNLRTDFQNEVWVLLDEEGLVTSRISRIRDPQGNLLQVATLHEGVSRNLTFGEQSPMEMEPVPLLPWADRDAAVYHDPQERARLQLLQIERVEAPPAEVLVLLEQEIENRACRELPLVEEAQWEARSRYEGWLDALAPEIGGEHRQRWLHVAQEHRQNEVAIVHENSPIPAEFSAERWLRLDEAGRVVAQVAIMPDAQGEQFHTGVIRDGISYDLADGEQRSYTPRRPELDGGFFASVDTMDEGSRGLGREEGQVGERPADLFSACQSYGNAGVQIGDLPYPVVGEQRHLWLDAETGQVLRVTRSYVDWTGRLRPDWVEDVTLVEVVDGLPPAAEALWQEAQDLEVEGLPATPTRPPVPYTYPGITLTVQSVSYETYETTVSLAIQVAGGGVGSEPIGASLANPVLVDEQGTRYQPGLGRASSRATPAGLLVESTQTFQPGAFSAKTLTLETGLDMRWPAEGAITLDLRGREPGDRWVVGQAVKIYGLAVPIEEAALVADPHAPPGALSLQLVAPCVSEEGVEVRYLEFVAEGAARIGDGPGGNACGHGQQRLVSTLTVREMMDGSEPAALESIVLQPSAMLHLVGPWELSWEVDRK